MSTQCPSDRTLVEFVAGELPSGEATGVSEHLRECPRCAARARVMESDAPPTEVLLRTRRAAPAPEEPTDPEFAAAVARLLKFPPDSTLVKVGDVIDDYRLLERIGEGGMGVVFRAIHTQLGKVVALKVIRGRRAMDPHFADRFRREMRAVGKLDHPNLVRATHARVTGGVQYLVTDYVRGTNLARLVAQDGPLPRHRACELVRQAALGLHHAHEHGLVHRDVKPSNLLLGTDGVVRVLDLGLARLPDEEPHGAPATASAPGDITFAGDDTLTSPGQTLGTRDYTAPEQLIDSHHVDRRADVYGLGCTLVYLLTGRPHAPNEPLPRELPPAVWGRLLAPEPGKRFPTALAAAEALAPLCAPPPPRSRRRIVLAALVALLAITLAAVVLWNK